jgi:hypothetical protein
VETSNRQFVGDSAPANGRLLTSTFTSNALPHLCSSAHMTTNSAQARLDNVKQTISPPMSQPINNEVKGRLALITGASGGYVIEAPQLRRQALTHQTMTASAQHARVISGPTAPRSP